GGLLVRVTRDASPAGGSIRRAFSPRIEALAPAVLRERLSACVRWQQEKINAKGDVCVVDARPPAWCVSAVHARGEWSSVRHLEAVVDYPVLRPDGTLLDTPGFDQSTGLLLETAGPLPKIPDRSEEHTSELQSRFD